MSSKTLQFTLTPVQGFVSQARRTRDLWAGSYLLSYLIANAMKEIGKNNIIFPNVSNDPLLGKLLGEEGVDNILAMRLGSIPNRFTATLVDKTGDDCKQAIKTCWDCIAEKVRDKVDPDGSLIDPDLWHQQIKGLWDQQWVIGDANNLLDQRKNLRVHYPADEGGEKCTVCGEREELSNIKEPLPKEINQWWSDNIRGEENGKVHDLDIRDGERLCAVCLTKRLFPKVAKQAIGWEVPQFFPSTAYLSAIDWLTSLFSLLKSDDCKEEQKETIVDAANEFLKVVKYVLPYKLLVAEKNANRKDIHPFINGIIEGIKGTGINDDFAILDGDIFYLSSIQLDTYTLKGAEAEQKQHRKNLIQALKKLYKAIRKVNPALAEPSPFYAIVFMDGDGMGKLFGNSSPENKQEISLALANFTKKVPEIVNNNNGILTYAGGDDVFALLPVSKALDCAIACRTAYTSAFSDLMKREIVHETNTTISSAIEYTHMNTPLSVVVKDSHQLLDDIAKDKTGRDAIACRVWKRGGPVLTWSQPWSVIDNGQLVEDIKKAFHVDDPSKFSSKFFYKLKDLFELIQAGGTTTAFLPQEITDLLVMEYLANREHDINDKLSAAKKREIAQERVKKIIKLCHESIREVDEETKPPKESFSNQQYKADGAMLIRFLSQKEV